MSSNSGNAVHGRRRKQDTRPATGRRVGLGTGLAVIVVLVLLIILF
ncbi:hypothetical protein [Arthrobacter zhaoguopingii]|nr:hypothetical protein [Arthrobacter zhaoguopingii]